jgi:myo-inositol-1(or 4)-monophosphatase
MHPLINIATKAARSASKIILRGFDRLDTLNVETKGHNDFVSEIDKMAEQEIINTIHESYPDHAIFAEESGTTGTSDYTWIIDPLDGTLNFLHGHPHFCISIAVKYKDRMEHGLIYDPLRQELFTATYGAGAFLNDRRIRVAEPKQLTGSSIALCIAHKKGKTFEHFLKIFAAVSLQAAGVRRTGSAALDFAYLASGRVDGLCGMNLFPWDFAAGSLLVQEAGGVICDFSGKNNFLATGDVVAGNPTINKILLQIAQEKTVG